MRDAAHLGVTEACQHAFEHAEDLRQRQPADERAQGAARDVLHRDVRDALVLEEVEHGHHVRVVERRRQARLADEPLREQRVAVEVEPLESYVAVECGLAGQIHHAHPAPRERSNDLIGSDPLRAHGLGATLPAGRQASQLPGARHSPAARATPET